MGSTVGALAIVKRVQRGQHFGHRFESDIRQGYVDGRGTFC